MKASPLTEGLGRFSNRPRPRHEAKQEGVKTLGSVVAATLASSRSSCRPALLRTRAAGSPESPASASPPTQTQAHVGDTRQKPKRFSQEASVLRRSRKPAAGTRSACLCCGGKGEGRTGPGSPAGAHGPSEPRAFAQRGRSRSREPGARLRGQQRPAGNVKNGAAGPRPLPSRCQTKALRTQAGGA